MKAVCSSQVCSASAMCRMLCLLLVLFTSAEVFSQDKQESTKKKSTQKSRQAAILFNTASRLYRQKNWQDAAATFGDFIKRYPRHEDALESHFARGYCYNRLKQHEKAVADLKIAGAQKGSRWSGDANFYLGRSLEALAEASPQASGRYGEAAEAYGQCAAIRLAALKTVAAGQRPAALSAHLRAFTSQGEAHYNAGQHQQVAQVLGLLLTSAGQYQEVTGYDRGLYFLGLGNYQLDRAAEKAGTKPDEKATLASLRALAAPAMMESSLWADATWLLARILHRRSEWPLANNRYSDLIAAKAPQAADSSYYRAISLFESSSSAGAGGAALLSNAATEFAAFSKNYPRHKFAARAVYYEGISLFNGGSYSAAAVKLGAYSAGGADAESAALFKSQALLCWGQALLLQENPVPSEAAVVFADAVDFCRNEVLADFTNVKAANRLVQVVYWRAEAKFQVAFSEEDKAKRKESFAGAAAAFKEVAGDIGKPLPRLQEEALFKHAEALFNAGSHKECAAAAKTYRDSYKTPPGRFTGDILKLSGRNALQAPAGVLDPAERAMGAVYYEQAAALSEAPAEKVRLSYLSGVSSYYSDDFEKASSALDKVLPSASGKDAQEYIELPFFLADSLAQLPRVAADDPAVIKRLQRAAMLFADYLQRAAAVPGKSAARHIPTARINQGLCYQAAGEWKGARESYTSFLTLHPDHKLVTRIRFSLAGACVELEDMEKAQKHYTQAAAGAGVEDQELAVRALLQASVILRRLERPKDALPLLEDAVDRAGKLKGDPAEVGKLAVDAGYQQAMALLESGAGEDALVALAAYLESFSDSSNESEVRLQLAYLQLDSANAGEALKTVAPLCDGPADTAGRDEALYLRGWASGALARVILSPEQGDPPAEDSAEAKAADEHLARMEAVYRTLVSEYPASVHSREARLELGQHLFNKGVYPEARKWFSELTDELEKAAAGGEAPGGKELLERGRFGLAFAAFEEEDFEQARGLFDKVSENSASELSPRATFQAARSWMLSSGEREAVERYNLLVGDLKPKAGEFYEESLLRLGECYNRLREYPEASKVLQKLLEEFPEGDLQYEALFALGYSLQFQDDYDGAVKAFRAVVDGTGTVVAARSQFQIGECSMDQKKYRRAAREYLSVVAGFDFDGPYRDWFRKALLAAGIAYQADGDNKNAATQWQELIEGYPESVEAKAAKKRLQEVKIDSAEE